MTKKELINYFKKQEWDIQKANVALFGSDLVFKAYLDSDKVYGVNFSPVAQYIFSSNNTSPFYQIIKKEDIATMEQVVYQDYLKNSKSLRKKIKEHQQIMEKSDVIWRNYQSRNKKEISNKEILKILKNVIQDFSKWWRYAAVGEGKGNIIEESVVSKFAENHNIKINKAREIVSILSHPKEQAVFTLEIKDFLNICLYILKNKKLKELLPKNNFSEILKDKELNKKVENYIKNYFWIKTDFYKVNNIITPEFLLKQVIKEISQKSKTRILKELEKINSNFKKIHSQKKRILSKIKLSPTDKKDIKFAELFTFWIDQRKIGTMKQLYYLYFMVEEIGKRFNLDYSEISFYKLSEMSELLLKERRVSRKEIEKRKKGEFLFYEKGKDTREYYGKEAKKLLNIVCRVKKENEVKGQVASTGKLKKIIGTARIVLDPEKDKFNNGEILITSMTRVEFVPLMKKAKAIITDEGGLACHAAIVSRELGIPCIIATKIATKILKNGNRIEMDMEKGIVRKI